MCGIAGVVGRPGAALLVKRGLRSLEYRGYDSCGIAWLDGGLRVCRSVGPVEGLAVGPGAETVALGHTRWATHGGVSEANAHPHLDCEGRVAVVHNGVLLNHAALRDALAQGGHRLHSETDSEALAHLWEQEAGRPGLERLRNLRKSLQGTYSIAILDAAEGAIYVAKERNPLWVAVDGKAAFLASDPVALRAHAGHATPLEDGDHGRLSAGRIEIFDAMGRPVRRPSHELRHLDDRTDKAGYEHYMLKEIHETPSALNRLIARHVLQAPPYVDLGLPKAFLGKPRRLLALGAGTSYHAALLGALYFQRLAKLPAEAKATPEYKDDPAVPEPSTLLAVMSQSGETLDTLQALHRLRSHPCPTLALTNHPTSSLGRQADHILPLLSGVEVSVAATKTFLSQALLAYLLALAKGRHAGTLADAQLAHAARGLVALPRAVERTLLRNEAFASLARHLIPFDSVFLLAKGLLVPCAMEGALKLKEIAYQHAEAYPAGELKHGPFALLTPETAVLFLHAPGGHEDAILNSLQEVKARGAPVFVLAMEGAKSDGLPVDSTVWLPETDPELAPLVFAVALHLLSYWTAKGRGLPIDKPRNLAKSVTVE
jgi:glucosamine--fructose-6-phosphate aminotransferase (isomerizing)